ncbi:MAG: hypothetical protein ACXWVQ_00740 [Methyloceanibacter sp.]
MATATLGSAFAEKPQGITDASTTAQATAHAGTDPGKTRSTRIIPHGTDVKRFFGAAGAGQAAGMGLAIRAKIGSISPES